MGERELVWYVSGTYTDPPEMWDADPAEVLAEMPTEALVEELKRRGAMREWGRVPATHFDPREGPEGNVKPVYEIVGGGTSDEE